MPTPQVAANTVAVALPYLQALTAAVTSLSKTPQGTADKIQAAMSGVQQGVAALAVSETAVQSKPIVDRIGADAQAVLTVAAGMPLPPPFNYLLMAASALLPTVLSVVNLMIATRTTVPAASPLPAAA